MRHIVFRVDSSRSIGSGHVMRCLALAEEIQQSNPSTLICFVCKRHLGNVNNWIKLRGFTLLEFDLQHVSAQTLTVPQARERALPPHYMWVGGSIQSDGEKTAKYCKQQDVTWVVVDHYGLDYRWERLVCKSGVKLLAIDDLCDRVHECDALLDQTYLRGREDYANLVPQNTKLLLGPDYALIARKFREKRCTKRTQKAQSDRDFKVLITFGGADPTDFTSKTLEVLKRQSWFTNLKLTVVLGPQYENTDLIELSLKELEGARILSSVTNIADLMVETDVCVSAAGSTVWELCCLGVPSILISTAGNQRDIAENLGRNEIMLRAQQVEEIPNLLHRLMTDQAMRELLSGNAKRICEGNGPEMVAEMMAAI